MSLEEADRECAVGAVAPRVSLAGMEAKIVSIRHFTAAEAAEAMGDDDVHPSLRLLSMCLVVLTNGFVLVGKSAPASAANFNAALGAKLAYEDAIRQLWPLEGYALRNQLGA